MGVKEYAAAAVQPDPNNLDYDFHRFIGMNPEGMREVQKFYLPYFAGCEKVVDLACGDADFVAMLLEQGVDAVGVDADAKTVAAVQAKSLPVLYMNVFDYLATAPSASVDGIFCAHLVEHLAYPQVVELIQQAARILRPGGRIVLATPDCRSLFSHLEMYYLHFGHVSFYHPRLLCFLLEHEGFDEVSDGVNPNTASPLLPDVQATARRAPSFSQRLPYLRTIPAQGGSLLHQLSYRIKRRLAEWLVLPFIDSLAASTQQQLAHLDLDVQRLGSNLQSINGPFECFATGIKPAAKSGGEPTATQPLPSQQ